LTGAATARRCRVVRPPDRPTDQSGEPEKLLAVEEAKLIGALNRAKEKVSDINQEIGRREQWLDDHPRATAQLQYLNGQVNGLDNENNHERWTVEGELNPRPAPTPRIEHSRSRDDDYHSIGRDNDRDYGFGL
jgi:hypothetical protein